MSESTKMKIEPKIFVVREVTIASSDHLCVNKEGIMNHGPTALIPSSDSPTPKRKPIPVPKSNDALRLKESGSSTKILDASIYEDVYDGKGAVAFQDVGTNLKALSLSSGEDANLYEEVQNEDRGLPNFPGAVESRKIALNEPAHGETCGKNPLAERGKFSAQQGQRPDCMKQTELHNKSSGQKSASNKAVSATEKISRMLLMENEFGIINKAAGKLSPKTKEERKLCENKACIRKEPEGNSAHTEGHLQDGAKDVDEAPLDKSNQSESLYDGFVVVHSLDSTQNRGPFHNEETQEVKVCVKKRVCTEEPLYAEVTNSLEEQVERKEPLYNEAIPFVEDIAKEPAVKLEESFYHEISLAESNSAEEVKQPLYDVTSTLKRHRKREQATPEHSLYGTAVAVKDSKLPRDERLHNLGRTLPPTSPEENPYCLATSIRENFSDGSSDDDEPMQYSLLVVKMSMKHNNKILSRNCESLEKKAYRLSRLWGDDRPCAKPTTGARNQQQQPRPAKSETRAKDDCEENPTEDIDSNDVYSLASHVVEDDLVTLRKWIVMHILDTERVYVGMLDLLFEHMQTFRSLANTGKSVIEAKDNAVIFYKISELHKSHFQFIVGLTRVAENWSVGDQEVGTIFQKFVAQEYALAREYLKNYDNAVKTIRRCWAENPVFAQLTEAIPVKFGKSGSTLSLEELLYKLIVRFQQNTLSMKDLINATPLGHPDYDVLQRVLKFALNCLQKRNETSFSNRERYLVKHGLLVERVDNVRTLREVFLYSDVLVCAEQKLSSRQGNVYETKWFIPLCDLIVDEKFSAQEDERMAILRQQVVGRLEKELTRLQSELKKLKDFGSSNGESDRRIKNLQKKIIQQKAALLEASPYLELKMLDKTLNRRCMLFMSSDYERTAWKEAITGMITKVGTSSVRITASEVSHLLELQKIPKLLGSATQFKDVCLDDELLSGCLRVVIHKLQGLNEKVDTICAVEIDSFGQFFTKAKTRRCASQDPSLDDEFDIDLVGARTLNILCYRNSEETDHLLGKCSLELSTTWLSDAFNQRPVALTDQVSIVISLQYIPCDKFIRKCSAVNGGTFGVRLEEIAVRENRLIPLVVTACIEKINNEGLGEFGLYRVSGLSAEVKRLKNAFNKDSAAGAALVKNTSNVHVLTSLLRLFFRELPEPLFTDAAYHGLIKGISLVDPEAKEKLLLNTLSSLPKCNYSTIMLVLDHLSRVDRRRDNNGTALESLAMMFGPMLLCRASLEEKPATMEQRLWLRTDEATAQATVFLVFLKLRVDDHAFPA